jgi:hypothetical protein
VVWNEVVCIHVAAAIGRCLGTGDDIRSRERHSEQIERDMTLVGGFRRDEIAVAVRESSLVSSKSSLNLKCTRK